MPCANAANALCGAFLNETAACGSWLLLYLLFAGTLHPVAAVELQSRFLLKPFPPFAPLFHHFGCAVLLSVLHLHWVVVRSQV